MHHALANAYERLLLPRLVDLACSRAAQMKQRERIVPLARGRVLEVGAGSGLNLEWYDLSRVCRLSAVDPSPQLTALARPRAARAPFGVAFVRARAEKLPLESGSFDTVVITYSLCTIGDPGAALAEMRRVLVRGGRLLFCEHGLAPDERTRRWQERLDPLWNPLSGGCHLGRDIPELVGLAGFRLRELSQGYVSGWRPLSYTYSGVAVRS